MLQPAVALLQRYFDIRPEEWGRFRLLFIIYVVFTVGLSWASNATRAELVAINPDLLAQAQWLSAIAVILASVVYTASVDRVPKDRMFMAVTLLCLGGVALAHPLLLTSVTRVAGLLALWGIYQLLFYIWVIHWGTYIIDFYDTRAAKRVFPVLGIARPVGTMLAGFSYGLLSRGLGFAVEQVSLVWAGSLALVAALLWAASRLTEPTSTRSVPPVAVVARAQASPFSSLTEGLRYVWVSPFLRWMALSALVVIAINTMVEYQTSAIFKASLPAGVDQAREIATYTATLEAVGNLVALAIQLFAFNALMRRFDLGTVNLIYPALVVVSTGTLVAAPALVAASLAYVNVNAFRRVFRDPVLALMANAAPAHTKGRARAVINGLISPAGILIAASLQQLIPTIQGDWFLPLLLTLATALYVVTALAMRREYSAAMVRVLEGESIGYLLARAPDADAQELGVTDRARLDVLLKQYHASHDPDMKAFIAQLIADAGGREAAPTLAQLAREESPALRAEIMRVLAREELHSAQARQIFADFIHDPDPAVRVQAVGGLLRSLRPRAALPVARDILRDPAPQVRALALPVMLTSRSAADRLAADDALNALLHGSSPEQHRLAVQVIREVGDAEQIARLVPLLNAQDEEVRYQATLAIEDLWPERGAPSGDVYLLVMRSLRLLLNDPVERVRVAELRLLRHISTPEACDTLAHALDDPSPRVRATALEGLVAQGRAAILYLQPLVESMHESQATQPGISGELAAVALGRIDPLRHRGALNTVIERKLRVIYSHVMRLDALTTYRAYPSVVILKNVLQAEVNTLFDEVFQLLSAVHRAESVTVIRESLASRDPRVRANAQEALETLTSPALAEVIAPLGNPALNVAELARYHPDGQAQSQGAFKVLYNAIHSVMPQADTPHWMRAIVLFALAEIGQAHPDIEQYLPRRGETYIPTLRVTPLVDAVSGGELDIRAVLVAVRVSTVHPDADVRTAARAALRVLRAQSLIALAQERAQQDADKEAEPMLSIVERMILLKKVSVFESLPVDRLRVLAAVCTERLYPRDTVIFRKDEPGDELYIVVEGEVEVGLYDSAGETFTRLAVYPSGSAFGEMTLFQGGTRSASARAASDVLMLALRSDALNALLHQFPDIAIALLATLSDRLREANTQIESLATAARRDSLG